MIHFKKKELEALIVYKSSYPKIRVGSQLDGGYVIADIPDYDLFISCGIGDNIDFEIDLLSKYNISNCYAFDGTIDKLPSKENRINFISKNIDADETNFTTNLHYLIKNFNKIFIKMDIESFEFMWLETLSLDQLKKIKQIVIEFHFPFHQIKSFNCKMPYFRKINSMMKILNTHMLIHLHGNNCCGTTVLGGVNIPNVFECTYINRSIQNFVGYNDIAIPQKLDFPNIPNVSDIILSTYPFIYNK